VPIRVSGLQLQSNHGDVVHLVVPSASIGEFIEITDFKVHVLVCFPTEASEHPVLIESAVGPPKKYSRLEKRQRYGLRKS
jgi:hypothetical protein